MLLTCSFFYLWKHVSRIWLVLFEIQLQNAFGSLGLPRKANRADDVSVLHGMLAAIDQLLTPTQRQSHTRISLLEHADSLQNNGRIICITVSSYNHSFMFRHDFNHKKMLQLILYFWLQFYSLKILLVYIIKIIVNIWLIYNFI